MIKYLSKSFCWMSLFLGLSACASTAQIDGDIKPSWLNESPSKYDQTEVIVQGYLVIRPEARQFWESKRKYDSYADEEYCLTLTNTSLLEPNLKQYNFKKVRLKGIFKSDINAGPIIDLGTCNDSGLEIVEIVK